jgi:ADP-ribose pyrophosphatase
MKRVEIEHRRVIFDDYFQIEEAYLKFERFDGEMSPSVRRLKFERGDSVAALVWNDDTKRAILTNQFRYPVLDKSPAWMVEVVAGVLEDEEDPEEAIEREILEEIGYKTEDYTHIATFFVSPGGTSERIFLFYVEVEESEKVEEGGGLEKENENIQLVEYSQEELWAAMENGEITDAKTLIALMWFKNKLGNK